MTSQPIVSILTPSFNRETFVAETLDSIRAQTWTAWENIVVDDGSSDRTKDIIAEYAARDPRIRLYDREGEPKGACTCRNEGVRKAVGKYVMFLDTDDLIEPFCLEQRVAAMEANPELDFAIFPSLMFEKEPHDLGLWWNIDTPRDLLTRQFHQDAICQGTGVLWRKEAFERIGMWDETLALWQDIDLFFRAFIQGYRHAKFFDLPPDLHNRISGTSLSRGGFFAPEKTRSRVRVIRNAVSLLKQNGMEDRVREARFMVAEIVSGAARSKHPSIARDLLNWALREGVVTPSEARRLRGLMLFHQMRMVRLPGVRAMVASTENQFLAETTLGTVPRAADSAVSVA